MKIILISGKSTHGKDTWANFLTTELHNKNKRVLTIHFGDCVKFLAAKYYNWNGEKDLAGRAILQQLGTEIVRAQDEHFWTDFVGRFIKAVQQDWDYILIPDWRFEEEHARLLDYFNFDDIITVRIERYQPNSTIPYENPLMNKEQLNHRSEIELDNYNCLYHIINDTTLEEFAETAPLFIKQLEEN